jgi:hypothetical protein
MADFNIKSKRDEEIESLAMNLRRNKLASSDSEARRMAEEMLSTSKKVQADFAEREKRLYGDQTNKNPEIELAHRQVEQLASNLAQGKSNVRIDIPELDENKPLREIVGDDSDYEKEDDEEVVVKEEPQDDVKEEAADEAGEEAEPEEAEPEDEPFDEIVVDKEPAEAPPVDALEETVRVEEENADDDEGGDDDNDDGSEEEPADDAPIDDTEKEEASDECEGPVDGEADFSVKELDNSEQLRKSEEERKAEVARMEESKIDLGNVFNVNK